MFAFARTGVEGVRGAHAELYPVENTLFRFDIVGEVDCKEVISVGIEVSTTRKVNASAVDRPAELPDTALVVAGLPHVVLLEEVGEVVFKDLYDGKINGAEVGGQEGEDYFS